MSPAKPLERLRTLPRASLKGAPTPVDRLERFEAAISSPYPIFIKRDHAIPFGFGGNKTYTAKALAGLVALVRQGGLPPGSSILFWHTGGQVGVLA